MVINGTNPGLWPVFHIEALWRRTSRQAIRGFGINAKFLPAITSAWLPRPCAKLALERMRKALPYLAVDFSCHTTLVFVNLTHPKPSSYELNL
jgi:hypothetical protein